MALWLALISVAVLAWLCWHAPLLLIPIAVVLLLELLGFAPVTRWIDRFEDWSYGYSRGDSDSLDV